MNATFKIEGLRELERSLQELPKATGKNVLRRTLLKIGRPIAEAMRVRAPDDPATSGNDLKGSINVTTRLSRRQRALHKKMFKSDRASVEAFVGTGVIPHAHMQEFGTVHHGPQPFARPAWDAEKTRALESVKKELANEIMKSANRLARRRARGR